MALTPGERVAFIGLGRMGLPMAGHLIAGGYRVRGFDLSGPARAALAGQGGQRAGTATEAVAGASMVVLMLPDSAAVESVLRDPATIAALQAGPVVADMSSSEPLRTRALAAELAARGVRLIDAPVSGGVAGARAGKLTIMAGGDPAALDTVQDVLGLMGNVIRVGPVGAGHALKALNNLLSATHLLATAEAMLIGQRFGLEPALMLQVINGSSGRSGSTENKWPSFVLPGTFDSGFGLGLMVKDMQIATSLARQVGSPHQLGETATTLWAVAAAGLPPGADHTEIARWVRDLAGTPSTQSSSEGEQA